MYEALPHSLELWDDAAKQALPLWLMAWLALLGVTFVASIAFVRSHRGARVALGSFVASHVLLYIGFDLALGAAVRNGLVSISHVICWTPALVVLIREVPGHALRSAYGIWCRLLTFIIGVSFVFDLRDAAMYLYYLATGHTVFA